MNAPLTPLEVFGLAVAVVVLLTGIVAFSEPWRRD